MIICGQQLAEIAMGRLMSLFIDLEYNNLYRYNQETDSDNKIIRIKEFARRARIAISGA